MCEADERRKERKSEEDGGGDGKNKKRKEVDGALSKRPMERESKVEDK